MITLDELQQFERAIHKGESAALIRGNFERLLAEIRRLRIVQDDMLQRERTALQDKYRLLRIGLIAKQLDENWKYARGADESPFKSELENCKDLFLEK